MAETKHTPGPWKVFDARGIPMGPPSEVRTVASGNDPSGMICAMCWQGDATEANAHLLGAAPDLLEALQALKRGSGEDCWCGLAIGDPHYSDHAPSCKRARAAVAKARGESNG